MTQAVFWDMGETIPGPDDPYYGFDLFWKKFPRDPRRRQRKTSKGQVKKKWKEKHLGKQLYRVMAALEEDIADIVRGRYSNERDRCDLMLYYPGVLPFMNQDKWDRDIEPQKPKPVVVERPVVSLPTPEERRAGLAAMRKALKMRGAQP